MCAMRRLRELFSSKSEGTAGEAPAGAGPVGRPYHGPSMPASFSSTVLTLKDGREVLLRVVERSDGPLVYEHMMTMSEESRSLFCPHPFDRLQAEAIAVDAHSRQSLRILALVGDRPAGYAYFTTRNAKSGFPMLGIAVTDEFQGIGLGRALMVCLINSAKAQGFNGLTLNVFKNNYRAQRLYTSLGFEFTGDADHGRQYSMRLDFAEQATAGHG